MKKTHYVHCISQGTRSSVKSYCAKPCVMSNVLIDYLCDLFITVWMLPQMKLPLPVVEKLAIPICMRLPCPTLSFKVICLGIAVKLCPCSSYDRQHLRFFTVLILQWFICPQMVQNCHFPNIHLLSKNPLRVIPFKFFQNLNISY